MKKFFASLMIMCAVAGMAIAKNDNAKTVSFSVEPPMSCSNCENKIKSNLRFEKGVKQIVTSLDEQTVTVTFDSTKTCPGKIVEGFSKIGYKASPAVVKAKAAQGCKGNCKNHAKDQGNGCCKEKSNGCCKDKAAKNCKEKAAGHCKDKGDSHCKDKAKEHAGKDNCKGHCKSLQVIASDCRCQALITSQAV